MKFLLVSILHIALIQQTIAQAWSFQRDKSHVNFEISNLGLTVEGTFEDFTVSIDFDPDAPGEGIIRGVIKVSSINTGIGKRDRHLKEEEYFHLTEFEEIIFESTGIKSKGNNLYAVTGDLTIKGITKAVSFDMDISEKDNTRVFKADLPLNRRHFKVGGSSWVLSDDLTAKILITLVR